MPDRSTVTEAWSRLNHDQNDAACATALIGILEQIIELRDEHAAAEAAEKRFDDQDAALGRVLEFADWLDSEGRGIIGARIRAAVYDTTVTPPVDDRPHDDLACPSYPHDHGPACHPDCVCGGADL